MELLGEGRLLGADPDTTFFKCARGINNRAVDRNVGDDWNSALEQPDSLVIWKDGRFLLVCCSQLRCSL